jgi:hypothetical protein
LGVTVSITGTEEVLPIITLDAWHGVTVAFINSIPVFFFVSHI